MNRANSYDYERMNEYFEETGRIFNEYDNILVTDSIEEMVKYLFETDSDFIIDLMKKITDIQQGDNMLETLVDEVNYVWHDYDNGKYYVIVQ